LRGKGRKGGRKKGAERHNIPLWKEKRYRGGGKKKGKKPRSLPFIFISVRLIVKGEGGKGNSKRNDRKEKKEKREAAIFHTPPPKRGLWGGKKGKGEKGEKRKEEGGKRIQ